MAFDVGMITRVSDEIEASAKRLKKYVNSPYELNVEMEKIESNLNSLKSLTRGIQAAGANASTAFYNPSEQKYE